MRIFVDTNIISELLEARSQVDYVDRIFAEAERNQWTRVLSVGSFYRKISCLSVLHLGSGEGNREMMKKIKD